MEYIKEGIKEYLLSDKVHNHYYMNVEYHILCHNHPDCLCSVQIRDVNDQSMLLYDVTGLESLNRSGKWQSLNREELSTFLEGLKDLLKVMDRFMLDISQIDFTPERIFRDRSGTFRWLYTPRKSQKIMTDIEKLFQWILTVTDYGDVEMIQYSYHAYWSVRNHPVSEESLQECIDFSPDNPELKDRDSCDDSFLNEYSYEEKVKKLNYMDRDVFRTQTNFDNVPDYSHAGNFQNREEYIFNHHIPDSALQKKDEYGDREHRLLLCEILCGVIAFVCLLAFIIFLVIGLQQNMVMELRYILIGLAVFMLILGDGSLRFHKKRKRKAGLEESYIKRQRDIPDPSYNYSWEEETGTTVLGIRKNMLLPALKSLDDGRVYVIDEFPYFIGSDSSMNQLTINEPSVSRRHAVIIRGKQTGNYDLQDLRSTNGTWIDQQELTYEKPMRLEPGKEIRFAEKSYEFVMLDKPLYNEYTIRSNPRFTGTT